MMSYAFCTNFLKALHKTEFERFNTKKKNDWYIHLDG